VANHNRCTITGYFVYFIAGYFVISYFLKIRVAEKISEINLPLEDEIKTIEEEDVDVTFSQSSAKSQV
jgi:hypothetical protein